MRGRGKQDKDVEKLMRTSKDVKLSWEATLWETSLFHVFSSVFNLSFPVRTDLGNTGSAPANRRILTAYRNAPKIYNAPWKMTQLRPILLLSSSYV